MRILLVDDDAMIGEGLSAAVGENGMTVHPVKTGRDGDEALAIGGHSVVLLDQGLPGKSRHKILKAAQLAGNHTPMLILTARDELDERVAGVDFGADDYM